MNYFIADILKEEGVNVFRQLSADKVRLIKSAHEDVQSYVIMILPYHNLGTKRNVARFASFPDYHAAVGNLLGKICKKLEKKFPSEKFYPAVDSSPIDEVHAAVECGLGVKGKNGLLINDRYGSYCFIAEIATTMKLSESITPINNKKCFSCSACIRACPSGALSETGFDKSKCLSHITQKKGSLSSEEEEAISNAELIWGCDRCQEVCPMNSTLGETRLECFKETAPIVTEEMINNPAFFDKSAFAWRKKETILRNIELKKR